MSEKDETVGPIEAEMTRPLPAPDSGRPESPGEIEAAVQRAIDGVPMRGESSGHEMAVARPGQANRPGFSDEVELLAKEWLVARRIKRGDLKPYEWSLLVQAAMVVVAHTPREQLALPVAPTAQPPAVDSTAPGSTRDTLRGLARRAREMEINTKGFGESSEWATLKVLLLRLEQLLT
jgi:hypothetical protein